MEGSKLRQGLCGFALLLAIVITASSINAQELPTHIDFTIDTTDRYQTIDHFGASDAWLMQFIGLWPERKRKKIAEWLFSMEVDDKGKPLGIGLSSWRFYIGGGSLEQGESVNGISPWKSGPTFMNPDGRYDWSGYEGQKYFLQQAQQYGVETFIGFAYTAPYFMTKNGLPHTTRGESNLDFSKMKGFSDYLVEAIQGVWNNFGVQLDYISPVNEPSYLWKGGQEGTHSTNYEISQLVKELDKALVESGEKATKILIPEAANYGLLSKTNNYQQYRQLEYFFGDFRNAVRNLTTVALIAAVHSYWTTCPPSKAIVVREKVNRAAERYNVTLWQTEYSVIDEVHKCLNRGAFGRDRSMLTALYVARIIHWDLTRANVASWSWWTALGVHYKTGLVYVSRTMNDGSVVDSHTLWSLGNFSRFVRPGMRRIRISSRNYVESPEGIMASTFLDERTSTVVVVVINYAKASTSSIFEIEGVKVGFWKPFLTEDGVEGKLKPLEVVRADERVEIPQRSVITLVGLQDEPDQIKTM